MKTCPICGEVIEKELDMPLFDGSGGTRKMVVHCVCKCEKAKKEEDERRIKAQDIARTIHELRKVSLIDERLKDVDFSSLETTEDNRKTILIAHRYVENFQKMIEAGQGLILYGNVGTGKSYTAAAIANELLNRQVPVIMTSFIKLLEQSYDFGSSKERQLYDRLNSADLLVIDDLGAERGTDFSLEKVYDIIDSRYRSNKPIILTTNLSMTELKNATDIRYTRIYDRIFEMCYPVHVVGQSWRKGKAAMKFREAKKILEV